QRDRSRCSPCRFFPPKRSRRKHPTLAGQRGLPGGAYGCVKGTSRALVCRSRLAVTRQGCDIDRVRFGMDCWPLFLSCSSCWFAYERGKVAFLLGHHDDITRFEVDILIGILTLDEFLVVESNELVLSIDDADNLDFRRIGKVTEASCQTQGL